MFIHTLTETAFEAGTAAARLPLRAAAHLTGNADDRSWPPALALEGAIAALAGLIGGLTHDRELEREATRRRDAIRELRRAAALETVAAAERDEAEDTLARRRAVAEDQREQATSDAKARRAAARRSAQQRKTAAAKVEADRQEAARAAERQERSAATRAARAERLEELEIEKAATATAKRAAAKRARAKSADAGVRASRARRAAS